MCHSVGRQGTRSVYWGLEFRFVEVFFLLLLFLQLSSILCHSLPLDFFVAQFSRLGIRRRRGIALGWRWKLRSHRRRWQSHRTLNACWWHHTWWRLQSWRRLEACKLLLHWCRCLHFMSISKWYSGWFHPRCQLLSILLTLSGQNRLELWIFVHRRLWWWALRIVGCSCPPCRRRPLRWKICLLLRNLLLQFQSVLLLSIEGLNLLILLMLLISLEKVAMTVVLRMRLGSLLMLWDIAVEA